MILERGWGVGGGEAGGRAKINLKQRDNWELVESCFTSTDTIGLLGTGAQDGHLDFHTAPELTSYDDWEF